MAIERVTGRPDQFSNKTAQIGAAIRQVQDAAVRLGTDAAPSYLNYQNELTVHGGLTEKGRVKLRRVGEIRREISERTILSLEGSTRPMPPSHDRLQEDLPVIAILVEQGHLDKADLELAQEGFFEELGPGIYFYLTDFDRLLLGRLAIASADNPISTSNLTQYMFENFYEGEGAVSKVRSAVTGTLSRWRTEKLPNTKYDIYNVQTQRGKGLEALYYLGSRIDLQHEPKVEQSPILTEIAAVETSILGAKEAVFDAINTVIPADTEIVSAEITAISIVKEPSPYRQTIMPHVLAARTAHQTLRAMRNNPGNPVTLRAAEEEFRLQANCLIVEVNKQRGRKAVEQNEVSLSATSLVARPQIPPAEKRNKFLQPDAPARPHNALGTISIYRERRIGSSIKSAIDTQVAALMPGNRDAVNVAHAMVHLVPEHIVQVRLSTPVDMRDTQEVAGYVVSLANLVGRYDAGLLQPPTAEELGSRGPEQNKHIERQFRALLGHFLREELVQPNRTQRELQDLYQQLSNYVRNTARHITPRNESLEVSYERVGNTIEQMPGLEGIMLAARLSTQLWQDLGLPCIDYMGETRMAEALRNIANSARDSRGNRGSMTAEGLVISNKVALQLAKIVDSVGDRLDDDDIDCQQLFEALESIDYGENVIFKLFDLTDIEQQGILYTALTYSNCFRDIKRELRDRI